MSIEPYSKFYWSDWRGDPKLRMCSLAARGLWMDILCIMHENEGYFTLERDKEFYKRIARFFQISRINFEKLLKELIENNVVSIDGNRIFSRRMIRDIERSKTNKLNGKNGGNPAITSKIRITKPDNQTGYPPPEPEGYPPRLSTSVITHGNSQIARSQIPDPERKPLGQFASMPGAEKIPLPTDIPADWLSESVEIKKWNEPTAKAVWEKFKEFYNGKTKTYIQWKVDWCKWWSGENYKENTIGSSEHIPKSDETWEQYCERRGISPETQGGAYA